MKAKSFGIAKYMSHSQCAALNEALKGEESEALAVILQGESMMIECMPALYETDGVKDAPVFLHYFMAGMDWYLTEKGEDGEFYGLADIGHGCSEMGYISVPELIENGAELDLYYAMEPLNVVRARHDAKNMGVMA